MEFRLRGLDGPVEVLRDTAGVPHCWAVSEHDAFFAQGFVHAADRLWQMDYDRRRGLGRAAEVVGPAGVTGDALGRRLDLAGGARRDLALLSAPARDMLTAYTAGVNALIGQYAELPAEFALTRQVLTGTAPEPWESWHCLLVYRVRHLTMGPASAKLWRAVVAQTLGPAAARAMASGRTGWQLACVPPGERCEGSVPAWAGLDDGGSNNWALAGSRTASGLPLLAGDPHRPLEMPNVYVQGHIAGPTFDVLGIGMPGVPGFPHFGHNDRVAWCITHAMADDQDLYHFPAGAPEGAAHAEVIGVRGAEPVPVEVQATARGPLVAEDLALAWAATAQPNTGFDALPAMLRARSVGDLFDTMRSWVDPANNLLAADTDGSIGYLTRGRVPVRARPEAAWTPVPAGDESYGWRGYVEFADLPKARDPARGFLFSANNRILAANSGPYLGLDVAPPWRASRILDTISALSGATVADMAALHRDVVSLPARRIASLLGDWAPLAGWDGQMTADSTAAAAYSVLRRELALLVLERTGLAEVTDHRWNRLLPGIRAESVVWRVAGDHLESGDESLLGGWSWRQALTEAISRAERNWAGEPWGELHATGQRHPLRQAGLDPPSVPYGGDMDTVQASAYLPVEGLRTATGSVARYAFDLANWDQSAWIVPLGAAGEPGSRHAIDQQEAWRTGRLLPALYSRRAVESVAEEQVKLLPDGR
ncbi:MAG TPA: penicillin acylase family protein [Streptosporangiaceae bacterium]|nr:penicillin acylase family protein [Streptosporangiaceae bacterium]